jgi:regulator of replication initiation timing
MPNPYGRLGAPMQQPSKTTMRELIESYEAENKMLRTENMRLKEQLALIKSIAKVDADTP